MPMLGMHLTQVVYDIDKYYSYYNYKHDLSVFKFWTIGGIFLHLFSDAVLFDMVLKTDYEDGVNTPGDLNDRQMSLGIT